MIRRQILHPMTAAKAIGVWVRRGHGARVPTAQPVMASGTWVLWKDGERPSPNPLRLMIQRSRMRLTATQSRRGSTLPRDKKQERAKRRSLAAMPAGYLGRREVQGGVPSCRWLD